MLLRDLRISRHANRVLQRALGQERSAVLAALRTGNIDRAADAITSERWENALARVWINAGDVVWDATVRDLGEKPKDHPMDLSEYDDLIERQGKVIADSHRRELYVMLSTSKSIERKADTLRRVARALYDRFRGETSRAAIRTGLQAAAAVQHTAARTVARATGAIIMKVWVTVGDNRVRPWHQAANGQRRRLNEDFSVGGESMKHPRDPRGSPANTYNCRCWTEQQRVGGRSTEEGAISQPIRPTSAPVVVDDLDEEIAELFYMLDPADVMRQDGWEATADFDGWSWNKTLQDAARRSTTDAQQRRVLEDAQRILNRNIDAIPDVATRRRIKELMSEAGTDLRDNVFIVRHAHQLPDVDPSYSPVDGLGRRTSTNWGGITYGGSGYPRSGNHIAIKIGPHPSNAVDQAEWIAEVITHEYTHVADHLHNLTDVWDDGYDAWDAAFNRGHGPGYLWYGDTEQEESLAEAVSMFVNGTSRSIDGHGYAQVKMSADTWRKKHSEIADAVTRDVLFTDIGESWMGVIRGDI